MEPSASHDVVGYNPLTLAMLPMNILYQYHKLAIFFLAAWFFPLLYKNLPTLSVPHLIIMQKCRQK